MTAPVFFAKLEPYPENAEVTMAGQGTRTVRQKVKSARKKRIRKKPVPVVRDLLQEHEDALLAPREPVLRRRLLLLEQDRHTIDELRDAFTERGYECEVALDLATARNILRERLMTMSVINALLTGISDAELIPELKACNLDMALVVYNGTDDKVRQRKFRSMGADSYLSKATDLKAVARAALKVLDARR